MGVADSPDLANLYDVDFEDKFKNSEDPCIAFFGRFINEILAIVYAPCADEAL